MVKFGLEGALVKNKIFKTYALMIVEKTKKKSFFKYLKREDMILICWLSEINLKKLVKFLKNNNFMSVAIIQVRSSSKRFPNKVMTSINNKPLLYYVMSRVKRSKKIKKIIVACSVLKSDSSIARFCKENKYKIYRGSLNDVLDRYVKVCKKYKLKYFVRINGDSPCIDPNLVDKAIQIYKKKKIVI